MRFLTSFYWQEENMASLTLQQICLKSGRDSLLLASVCDSRDFGSRLVDWFHEEILRDYGKRGGLDWEMAVTALHKMAKEAAKVRAEQKVGFSCSGILCAGAEFVLFGQGGQRVYLLNRGFKGSRVKVLLGGDAPVWQERNEKNRDECREEFAGEETDKDESGRKKSGKGRGVLELHQGIIESGVGLLFATQSFCSQLTKQILSDCLGGDIGDEKQISLHLKELGEFSRDRGEQNLGAVFIRTL